MPDAAMATTGVTGQTWRAGVTPWGGLVPWDESPPLEWYVAADDRWHVPAQETSTRHRRVEGTAVFETRVRVPDGDVVQVISSVADHGGLTLIEFRNESPLPVAVALNRRNVLTNRPPADVPIEGIDLPASSTIVLPVGHRSSVTVGLPHRGGQAGQLPGGLPTSEQVVRGWQATLDQASRLLIPDEVLAAAVAGERCEAVLGNLPTPDDDPIGTVLAIVELVRMGEPPSPWVEELAIAVEATGGQPGWDADAALARAGIVLVRAGEERAVRDLERIVAARTPAARPSEQPDGIRVVAWAEGLLARGGALLPDGLPPSWLGVNFEVYTIPTGSASAVSFAVRWHGERPAVLWEQTGDTQNVTAPAIDPSWSTNEVRGEALWAAPSKAVT